jgi:hypothetical protein
MRKAANTATAAITTARIDQLRFECFKRGIPRYINQLLTLNNPAATQKSRPRTSL